MSDPHDQIIQHLAAEGVGIVESVDCIAVLICACAFARRSGGAKLDAEQRIANLIVNATEHRDEGAMFFRELMIQLYHSGFHVVTLGAQPRIPSVGIVRSGEECRVRQEGLRHRRKLSGIELRCRHSVDHRHTEAGVGEIASPFRIGENSELLKELLVGLGVLK